MSIQKLVNGELLNMSPEEEAAFLAESAANAAAQLLQTNSEISQANAAVTDQRSRSDVLAEIERQVDAGVPQVEINKSIIQLLKGES